MCRRSEYVYSLVLIPIVFSQLVSTYTVVWVSNTVMAISVNVSIVNGVVRMASTFSITGFPSGPELHDGGSCYCEVKSDKL